MLAEPTGVLVAEGADNAEILIELKNGFTEPFNLLEWDIGPTHVRKICLQLDST